MTDVNPLFSVASIKSKPEFMPMRLMMRTLLMSLLLLVAFGAAADSGENNLLTAEAMWQLDRIGAPVISADGRQVVAPVTRYDMDSDEAETRLWLFAADGSSRSEEHTSELQSRGHLVCRLL